MTTTAPTPPAVVPVDEWFAASQEFLKREKAFTKARDALGAARRALPWTPVETAYTFETEDGPRTLADLFGDRSQLVLYHFMYAPGEDEGCPGCSFLCDHLDAARAHFERQDVAFVVASRAPLEDFAAFKRRMGWGFRWVSSAGTGFNEDFDVAFSPEARAAGPVRYNFTLQPIRSADLPGLTVFAKDAEGRVYRTYSTYDRGLDLLLTTYNVLDLTPKGRDEASPMDWVRFHDRYEG